MRGSCEAVSRLARQVLSAAGLSRGDKRFSSHIKKKFLAPKLSVDRQRPWAGRRLLPRSTPLGELFLPYGKLKLSGEAGMLIKAELLKGRDWHAESCTPGRRSVSRDVSRLLSHRLPRLWECVTSQNIGLFIEEAQRERFPKPITTLAALYDTPL